MSLSVKAEVVLKRPAPPGESEFLRCPVLALVRWEADGSMTVLDLRVLNPETAEQETLTTLEWKRAAKAVEMKLREGKTC